MAMQEGSHLYLRSLSWGCSAPPLRSILLFRHRKAFGDLQVPCPLVWQFPTTHTGTLIHYEDIGSDGLEKKSLIHERLAWHFDPDRGHFAWQTCAVQEGGAIFGIASAVRQWKEPEAVLVTNQVLEELALLEHLYARHGVGSMPPWRIHRRSWCKCDCGSELQIKDRGFLLCHSDPRRIRTIFFWSR